MDKLSMTTLLNSIQTKFVLPAIEIRKKFLLNYLKSMTEENSRYLTFIVQESNGNQSLIDTSDDACYLTDTVKTIYLFELPDFNQVEIKKHLQLIDNLRNSIKEIQVYLCYLNNKSDNVVDIAYALPAHINQLVPMVTPETYSVKNLRDAKTYALLNEIQIKLLLLS
jgi:hypothetical protein